MADTFKFRIDHHGSLVKPPALTAGTMDQEIAEAVRMQRKIGLSAVTDGEFRRAGPLSAVVDAVSGFRRTGDRWLAVEELKPHRTLVADEVAAVAALTRVPAKATLPSPAFVAARCFDPDAGSPWASARELGEALARIIRDEIQQILARGIRYVQLNNPGVFDPGPHGFTLDDAIAVDRLAVALDDKPDDVRIALCPATALTTRVDRADAERLFASVPVDRWILPFTSGDSAETDLLRAVPADRDVCLGIVDPAAPALEDVGVILDRMDLAARLKDWADLAVSPSAGFPSRADLVHVETIARMCWGNEL